MLGIINGRGEVKCIRRLHYLAITQSFLAYDFTFLQFYSHSPDNAKCFCLPLLKETTFSRCRLTLTTRNSQGQNAHTSLHSTLPSLCWRQSMKMLSVQETIWQLRLHSWKGHISQPESMYIMFTVKLRLYWNVLRLKCFLHCTSAPWARIRHVCSAASVSMLPHGSGVRMNPIKAEDSRWHTGSSVSRQP